MGADEITARYIKKRFTLYAVHAIIYISICVPIRRCAASIFANRAVTRSDRVFDRHVLSESDTFEHQIFLCCHTDGGMGIIMANIPHISPGDTLLLKKTHPCGSNRFTVMRVGTDIRIVCSGCGRDMTLPREKLERAIRKIYTCEEDSDGR